VCAGADPVEINRQVLDESDGCAAAQYLKLRVGPVKASAGADDTLDWESKRLKITAARIPEHWRNRGNAGQPMPGGNQSFARLHGTGHGWKITPNFFAEALGKADELRFVTELHSIHVMGVISVGDVGNVNTESAFINLWKRRSVVHEHAVGVDDNFACVVAPMRGLIQNGQIESPNSRCLAGGAPSRGGSRI